MNVKTIGVITNTSKQQAIDAAKDIISYSDKLHIKCILNDELADLLSIERNRDSFYNSIDVLVVLGGDGTILNSVSEVAEKGIPVLGVNFGRIGFISEIEIGQIRQALERLVQGDYSIEERMMLSCSMDGKSLPVDALNDIILYKHSFSGVILVEVVISGMSAGTISCDGILASTQTGSTAYSLSAGGPLISPNLNVILVTPVCSHNLAIRPIVVSENDTLEFKVMTECDLIADGNPVRLLSPGQIIKLSKSKNTARFIRLSQKNYFDLVKKKLS